jgi:accessory colonization factor AcfC
MKIFYLAMASALTVLTVSNFPATMAAQMEAGPDMPVLHVYGPGGPLPAMREAAEVFGREKHVKVLVVAGPTPKWLPDAKKNADLIYSGSEDVMSDFETALAGTLDPATVVLLYLRKAAILVRPGNPAHISGLQDLMKPGHHILVVNGAGQRGLWEDVVARRGEVASLVKFRANVAVVAANSAEAKNDWVNDSSLDAWLIWSIWQVSNPSLAETVPIDEAHQIYRDCGIGLTNQGKARPEAADFIRFLHSLEGANIFQKWGWSAPR